MAYKVPVVKKIYLKGTLHKTYLKLIVVQNVKYVLDMGGQTEKLKFTLTKGHLLFLLPLKESGREASKEQASHSTDKNKILEIKV